MATTKTTTKSILYIIILTVALGGNTPSLYAKETSFWGKVGKGVVGGFSRKAGGTLLSATLTKLGLFSPKPDYEGELKKIELKLDEVERKIDNLQGSSTLILDELQAFKEEYRTDEIKKIIDDLEASLKPIFTKASDMSRFRVFGEDNGSSFYSYHYDKDYNITDISVNTDKVFYYAEKICSEHSCNNKLERDIIKILGGNPDGGSKPFTENNSLYRLNNDFLLEEDSDWRKLKDLNTKLVTLLGTGAYNKNSGTIHISPLNSNSGDITVPWHDTDRTIRNLQMRYYRAIGALYNMQLMQLAFYYAHIEYFQDTEIDPKLLRDNPSDIKNYTRDQRKERFKSAISLLDKYFDDLLLRIETQFGDGEIDKGLIRKHIPSLANYINIVINNEHTFKDKDLLNQCNISSVILPHDNRSEDNYRMGRINFNCFDDNGGRYSSIKVGHDIPYKTTSISEGEKTKIDDIGIDGFHYISNRIEAGYLSEQGGELQGGFVRKNYQPWINHKILIKDEPQIALLAYNNGPIPYSGGKNSIYYSEYKIDFTSGLWLNHIATNNYDKAQLLENGVTRSSKSRSPLFGNGEGYPIGGKAKDRYLLYLFEGRNGNPKNMESETISWNELSLLSVFKTGNLFFINNAFPENKVPKRGKYWYAEHIIPMCLNNSEFLCKNIDLNIKNPLDLEKGKPSIIGNNPYQLGSKSRPKTAIKFFNGTEISIHGELYGGYNGKSVINLTVKDSYLYRFHADNTYFQWLAQDKGEPESYAYLDGTLSYSRKEGNQVILSNGEHELIFTEEGKLKLIQIDEAKDIVLSFCDKDTYSHVTLKNGDIVFSNNDGKSCPLLETMYKKNNLKWIPDPFSKILISQEGDLVIISSAKEIYNPKKSLGSLQNDENRVIFKLSWEEDNKWPEIDN